MICGKSEQIRIWHPDVFELIAVNWTDLIGSSIHVKEPRKAAINHLDRALHKIQYRAGI